MWLFDANGSSDLIIENKIVYLKTRNRSLNERYLNLILKQFGPLSPGQSDRKITGFWVKFLEDRISRFYATF